MGTCGQRPRKLHLSLNIRTGIESEMNYIKRRTSPKRGSNQRRIIVNDEPAQSGDQTIEELQYMTNQPKAGIEPERNYSKRRTNPKRGSNQREITVHDEPAQSGNRTREELQYMMNQPKAGIEPDSVPAKTKNWSGTPPHRRTKPNHFFLEIYICNCWKWMVVTF